MSEVLELPADLSGYWPDPAEHEASRAAADARAAAAAALLEQAAECRRLAAEYEALIPAAADYAEEAARLFLRSEKMGATLAAAGAGDATILGDVAWLGELAETSAQDAIATRDRITERRNDLLEEAGRLEAEAVALLAQ